MSDPRTRHIPLILETPAFDGPGSKLAEGMDIWKKEVEVLHRLSSGLSASSEIERWTSEVKELVDEANKQNNSKTKKVAGTRSTRGGKKRKPESEGDDGDASDDT